MGARVKDPGIGTSSSAQAKRFINPNGTFNIKHVNKRRSLSESYHYLINISWPSFFAWVFLGYIFVNIIFALLYTSIGVSAIIEPSGSLLKDFINAFFFSAQTLTTVGYGAMSPDGVVFGIISSIEALIGLLSFSFITGLLYGRFSKPRANVRFSTPIIVREHNGVPCIMFRLMSRSSNVMIHPHVEATLALSLKTETGSYKNNFFSLSLERDRITYLPTTWTLVHTIDDSSPLKKYPVSELRNLHAEILILASYYDEAFAQEVHQAHSYLLKDLLYNSTFVPAFSYNEEGQTVLDHSKLDKTRAL